MDLIATYLLFFTTTSFLGLITTVLVDFRCNWAFSFMKGTPSFVKGELSFVKETLPFVKGELSFVKETLSFVKGELSFVKETLSFVKGELSFVKGEPAFVKETLSFVKGELPFVKEKYPRGMKSIIMACNYGDRLAMPIVN